MGGARHVPRAPAPVQAGGARARRRRFGPTHSSARCASTTPRRTTPLRRLRRAHGGRPRRRGRDPRRASRGSSATRAAGWRARRCATTPARRAARGARAPHRGRRRGRHRPRARPRHRARPSRAATVEGRPRARPAGVDRDAHRPLHAHREEHLPRHSLGADHWLLGDTDTEWDGEPTRLWPTAPTSSTSSRRCRACCAGRSPRARCAASTRACGRSSLRPTTAATTKLSRQHRAVPPGARA